MRSKEKRVWAVSSGSYSDYRVHAVFSSEEAADAVCAAENRGSSYGDYGVEEYVLYDKAPERFVEYTVTVGRRPEDRFGDPTSAIDGGFYLWESERLVWPWEASTSKNMRPTATRYGRDGITVRGRDAESVRKTVHDAIARVKAEEAGL